MSLADLVKVVVDEVRPENFDPACTTVTDEGPGVEIVILPHRDLDGVSLISWTDHRRARLLWAQVGDLSRHDDIDLGVTVSSFPYEGDWHARLREGIASEMRRPIRLQVRTGWFGRNRVDCSIVAGGVERRIGTIVGLPKAQFHKGAAMTTSLAGGPRPWFSLPPNITHARASR